MSRNFDKHWLYWLGQPGPSARIRSRLASWRLGEASGARSDDTGRGNNLTDNNTVTQAVGKIGSAAQFTAANSESLSLADNADMSMGTGKRRTWSFWVYFDTVPASVMGLVMKWHSSGEREFAIIKSATNAIALVVSSDGAAASATATSTITVTTGQWYHVLAGYDGTNIYLSVDNETLVSAAFSADVFDGAQAFRLGAYSDGSNFLNGRLDACRVYDRWLTAGERAEEWNSGAGVED